MKKISLLISILFITSFSYSQKIAKAYKYLNNKEYDKASDEFNKCIEAKIDEIPAKFGLATLYSDVNFSKANYSISYRYLNFIESKYDKLKNKDELKLLYNIDKDIISEMKKDVLKKAYQDIDDKSSVFQLTNFISKFKDTDIAERVKISRDSLAFELARAEDTYNSYSIFYTTYPDAEQVPLAKERFKKIWLDIYAAYSKDGELSSLKIFENNYPDFPFYEEVASRDKVLAVRATQLRLNEGYINGTDSLYVNYIKEASGKSLTYTALQRYIEPNIKAGDNKKALGKINNLKSYFPGDSRVDKLISVLNDNPGKLLKISISDSINTDYAYEYAPSITADGKKLYFCAMNRTENLAPGNEDIFVSKKENGSWTKPVNIIALNTPDYHEAPLAISSDGNTMLLYSSSDIYFSKKTQTGWTKKKEFQSINTKKSWEADAMITADGNSILFISDRQGNIGNYHAFSDGFNGSSSGNTDIYISHKTESGWSEPENLSSIINTPYSERSPFLHPDMKTLYFSSEGHGSVGKLDVFKSTRLSDTSWTEWSEPVNLGLSVNTPNDEYDYRISTDGKTAYFSAFNDSGADIFTFEIPKNLRPQTVTSISGKIADKNGNKQSAVLRWEDLETGELIGFAESDPETAEFIIVLPNGKNYGYFVEKENFYPTSGNIDLRKTDETGEIKNDILLLSVEQIIGGEVSISIKNLFFDTDKFEIKPESYPELNRLAEFIKSQPSVKIEISGHTDNKGSTEHNKTLSENRAKSVKTYLENKGCTKGNLLAVGFGDSKPVSTNDSEEGRAENRRVEFRIKK